MSRNGPNKGKKIQAAKKARREPQSNARKAMTPAVRDNVAGACYVQRRGMVPSQTCAPREVPPPDPVAYRARRQRAILAALVRAGENMRLYGGDKYHAEQWQEALKDAQAFGLVD